MSAPVLISLKSARSSAAANLSTHSFRPDPTWSALILSDQEARNREYLKAPSPNSLLELNLEQRTVRLEMTVVFLKSEMADYRQYQGRDVAAWRGSMSTLQTVSISAHLGNIIRYRKILGSYLTDHERCFVERRIAEEESALQRLVGKVACAGSSANRLARTSRSARGDDITIASM